MPPSLPRLVDRPVSRLYSATPVLSGAMASPLCPRSRRVSPASQPAGWTVPLASSANPVDPALVVSNQGGSVVRARPPAVASRRARTSRWRSEDHRLREVAPESRWTMSRSTHYSLFTTVSAHHRPSFPIITRFPMVPTPSSTMLSVAVASYQDHRPPLSIRSSIFRLRCALIEANGLCSARERVGNSSTTSGLLPKSYPVPNPFPFLHARYSSPSPHHIS